MRGATAEEARRATGCVGREWAAFGPRGGVRGGATHELLLHYRCRDYNSSAHFEPSIVKQRNESKCTQSLRNKTKHKFSVQWGGSGAFIAKNSDNFVARTFALIAPFQLILHQVSCSNEMVPNVPKHYETRQQISLRSNGVDWVRSL